ncbi:GNAT family N-acetyltransferase [Nocardia nova]
MDPSRWPSDLPARAIRFARGTWLLSESSRFYREIVGLPVLAEFHDHDGYDGVVFALPDSSTQWELVTPPRPAASSEQPDREHAMVVYLAEPSAVETIRSRLGSSALHPFVPENPYWTRRGAFGVLDPDGWPVIFVPPGDEQDRPSLGPATEVRVGPPNPARDAADVEIVEYEGPHRDLIDLFRLAEDSPTVLDGYIDLGTVWVARDVDGAIVGHLHSVVRDGGQVCEVVNTAVVPAWRGRGVGRRLLEHAIAQACGAGASRVELATAAADIGNLRFYQRCGFRMSRVVRDAFVPATGYHEPIRIDGIPLRDQLWFTLDLSDDDRERS